MEVNMDNFDTHSGCSILTKEQIKKEQIKALLIIDDVRSKMSLENKTVTDDTLAIELAIIINRMAHKLQHAHEIIGAMDDPADDLIISWIRI